MPLGFEGSLDRRVVADAVQEVSALVRRTEVADSWTRESACAGMTVGGLTRHLIGQPVFVATLPRQEPPADVETIGVLEHYERAAWVREDLDGETNQTIRESSDQQGAEGVDAAIALLDDALAKLGSLDDAQPVTFIPWQGWALQTDDFLVTRLMEMVVHCDDLAASVDLEAPDFGPDVLDPVLRLLTALSLLRHGQDALIRTLTRPQRAPGVITAF